MSDSAASNPVSALLTQAMAARASDLHLEPEPTGYRLRLRIDGVLEEYGRVDTNEGRVLVNCLMVAAKLLTYKPDVPQEGRLSQAGLPDARLAVMPTVNGPRAVLRLASGFSAPASLLDLQLPLSAQSGLNSFVERDAGLLVICGPAGSGKTTTAYAVLDAIAKHNKGLSIVSIEDPVERHLEGVAQVEVKPFGELTFARALRSMLRQDPQVICVGEMRDAESAQIAVQATLTGHRVLTTLHAPDGAGAIIRLLEMGVEPYQIASSLVGVLSLRLLRKKNPHSKGYQGRLPVAEWMPINEPLRKAILAKEDASALALVAKLQGLRKEAEAQVAADLTDDAEVIRVFGL